MKAEGEAETRLVALRLRLLSSAAVVEEAEGGGGSQGEGTPPRAEVVRWARQAAYVLVEECAALTEETESHHGACHGVRTRLSPVSPYC